MVDDGSTDNSPAICDDFAARYHNIRVIHQENKGLSGARNAGMNVARGELITFVDSDDSLHPEMLERLFRQMEETGADISSAGTDTGKHVGGVLTPAQAITCLLKENTTFNTSAWGKLYRTKLFDGIRFPEGLVFEDYAVIPQVIHRANRIAHTDEALYRYRTNNLGSITKAPFNPAHMQYFIVSERVIKFLEENHPQLCRYARLRQTNFAVSFFRRCAQSGAAGTSEERCLTRYVREGLFPYLFSAYKLTAKAYGMLIAVCPPLARKLFAPR